MRGSSLKLLVCEIVAIEVATAIAVILFTFDLKITAAQEQESEDLQQQFPPSSSSSASVDDRITEIIQEIIANSTQIYDGSNSSSIDNSTSSDYLTLRWSNITHVAARASHVFNTKCQTNEIPLGGTWYMGSPQYLSVIANYPSIGGEEEIPTENSLSWTVVIFNSHESNSFPAVGGVLCKSTTIFANATTAGQLSRDEEEQQEEQSETSPTEASSLPRETESDRVRGLTATLNGDTFTTGNIITVNGTVEEREPGSFVGIEVIDPQSEIVERGVSPITADNNTFTYSFVAGEQQEEGGGEGGGAGEGQQQQQEEQEEDEEFSYIDEPMVTSGNYRMVLTYFPPGEPLEMEQQLELVFEYNNDTSTTSTTVVDDDITDAEELGGAAAEATATTNATLTPSTQGEEEDDDDNIDHNAEQMSSVSSGRTTNISIVPGSMSLTDIAYQPNPVQISVGDTIIWTNDDSEPHTATSGQNARADGRFDSGIMAPTRTFEHTFTEPGEYPYFCILHPNMVGTVSVLR
jgi:plastocyanin